MTSEIEIKINTIVKLLRTDDGISSSQGYVEQISWILFLKFINDYQKHSEFFIDEEFRWDAWAIPNEHSNAKTGKKLIHFIKKKLFPYLKSFKATNDSTRIKYRIGYIFHLIENRIASPEILLEACRIINTLDFQSSSELFELSQVYERLLHQMGNDGTNGEYHTPRPVIKAIVECIEPRIGESVYDGAMGSGGFLCEVHNYLKSDADNFTCENWNTLNNSTFYGIEKTPFAYLVSAINLTLHGIKNPSIIRANTLTTDGFGEKQFDIILKNPPYASKEPVEVQSYFPIKTNVSELLFLQHIMQKLKANGRAAVVVPDGVLFQTKSAYTKVKKKLLEGFNLHTILSLPSGVFLPYTRVKTNVLFVSNTGATSDIWYYEMSLNQALNKSNPINYRHFEEFIDLYRNTTKRCHGVNNWSVNVSDIKNYDLMAKNPNKSIEINHLSPEQIITNIKANDKQINALMTEIERLVHG